MGPLSDPKSEFSGTESPDPDPWESQKCLLGFIKFDFCCTASKISVFTHYKGPERGVLASQGSF